MSKNAELTTNMAWSTILTIVFVVLKLTHVIDWSWWWVVSPTIINVVLIIGAVLLLMWFVKRKNKR